MDAYQARIAKADAASKAEAELDDNHPRSRSSVIRIEVAITTA
jgi:hypothetical protein